MSTQMFKGSSIVCACRAVALFAISAAGSHVCQGRVELQADDLLQPATLVYKTSAAPSQREFTFKARCVSHYNGSDSIEVDRDGEQSRLKIDVRHFPRFYYANGVENKDAKFLNVVVRFNQNIYITYNGNTIVRIEYAD